MPAKASLLDLPGLASFSFSPVPNYFCAALHTNTANASELCDLRKFHYYTHYVVCQGVKMWSKTSPKSALDEFHDKTVNHVFLFSSPRSVPFTHAHRAVPYSQDLPPSSCSSLVNTFKQAGSLLSSVTLQPLRVTVHCLLLDHSLHPSAPSLISLNRIRMVYCKNTTTFPMYFDGTPFWLKLAGKRTVVFCLSLGESLSSYPNWELVGCRGLLPRHLPRLNKPLAMPNQHKELLHKAGRLPMSSGWSECVRTGGCCFLRTISTMRDEERCSNSFIIMTWLKWDSFTTKFRQCSLKIHQYKFKNLRFIVWSHHKCYTLHRPWATLSFEPPHGSCSWNYQTTIYLSFLNDHLGSYLNRKFRTMLSI